MNALVCMSQDRSIGRDNRILYPFVKNFNWFDKSTEGCVVVMGRHTLESLGPLDNRINIVLTSKKPAGTYRWTGKKLVQDINGQIIVFNEFNELVYELKMMSEKVWVIGGGKVYSLLLPYVNIIEIIEVQTYESDSDVKFPELSTYEWNIYDTSEKLIDCKSDVQFKFKRAVRKQMQEF